MHGASFIHAFHIRILRFQDRGGRVAVGSCCLFSSTFLPPLSLQRSLPRIQAVLNREKWIFWSERISTSNPFLLRHCLLSPWWFMGGRVSSVLREKQYLLDAWLAYSRTSLRIEIAGGSVTMLKTSLIPLFPRRGGEEIYWELFLGRRVLDELFGMETLWKGNFV